jgi:hypothetical protein
MPDSPNKRGEQNSREREDIEVPCPHCKESIQRSQFRELVKEAKKEEKDEPTTWVEVIVKIVFAVTVAGAVYYMGVEPPMVVSPISLSAMPFFVFGLVGNRSSLFDQLFKFVSAISFSKGFEFN